MADDQQQCVFCAIANGKIPSKVVYEDDKLTAVLDINPAAEGHILLIPKQHVQIMPQMDDELAGHVGVIAKQLSNALIRAFQCEGTSVFAANGAVAGQRAPHFMLHIIPRKEGDDIGLMLPHNKLAESTMKQVFDKLAPAVAKNLGVEVTEKAESPSLEEQKQGEVEKEEKKEQEEKTVGKKEPGQKTGSDLDKITDLLTGGK